ncbi:unnamed protein product [Allacma fusca]|uniref:Uncharacterized protein n=1 Tax=Allacma fusca TaxID=39272 RepID=A0A8J2LEL7_9HEXA|nr:unnamed protein product [Allacma fusca]
MLVNSWTNIDIVGKCKFPDEPRQTISKLRSNKSSKRCDSWSSYLIVIHFTNDNFQSATRYAIKLQYSSSVETGVDTETEKRVTKPRKRTKRVIFSLSPIPNKKCYPTLPCSTDDSDGDVMPNYDTSNLPPLFLTKEISSAIAGRDKFSTPNCSRADYLDLHNSQQRNEGVESVTSAEDCIFASETGQNNNNTGIETDALERFSERFFTEFRKFEVSVLKEIHAVKSDVEILRSIASRKSSGNLVECPITLPIRSETEMKIAEKLAQKGFRVKLVKFNH